MAMGIFEVLRCRAGFYRRTAITRHCHVLSTHERLIANRSVDKMDEVPIIILDEAGKHSQTHTKR
jgi:hypothetical protein